jgi:hypothetical protein
MTTPPWCFLYIPIFFVITTKKQFDEVEKRSALKVLPPITAWYRSKFSYSIPGPFERTNPSRVSPHLVTFPSNVETKTIIIFILLRKLLRSFHVYEPKQITFSGPYQLCRIFIRLIYITQNIFQYPCLFFSGH